MACANPVRQWSARLEIAAEIGHAIARESAGQPGLRSGLADGAAGHAVFFAHLSRVGAGNIEFRRHALDAIERAANGLQEGDDLTAGLYAGVAGVAWAARHVSAVLQSEAFASDDEYDEILSFIEAYVSRDCEFEYDLVNGLAGIGLWALSVSNSAWKLRVLRRVVSLLMAAAERKTEGLTWPSPQIRKRFNQRQVFRDDGKADYNLGLAHGIPGVIGFFATCLEHGIQAEVIRPALIDSISWLKGNLLSGGHSAFPFGGGSDVAARAAWCYGDPGIACVLYRAARVLRCESTASLARFTAERFLARRMNSAGVQDSGICHGTAGLALISRLLLAFHPTDAARGACDYWRNSLLRQQWSDRNFAGFSYYSGLSGAYEANPGFLVGAAGVGLVLLDTDADPSWGFPLLLSP